MEFLPPIYDEGINFENHEVNVQGVGSDSCFCLPFVVDASGVSVQVGIAGPTSWRSLQASNDSALEGLFSAAENTLNESENSMSEIDAVFFCEGPGSTLGLRIAAAFVRTIAWSCPLIEKIFQYNSLDLAARMNGEMNTSIQASFRRGFRFVRTGQEPVGKKEIVPEEKALDIHQESLHLPDFRNPKHPPPPAKIINYDLSSVRGLADLLPISTPSESAIPYSPRPAEFTKWSKPEIQQ